MIDGFPAGESCFVDANILGYASIDFAPLTARSRAFLGRVAAGERRANGVGGGAGNGGEGVRGR